MNNNILGLHHITAIAGDAQQNLDFYTKVLGQRLVKKTVNFDDPGTYHFYFGNEQGTPGTILTFFPWQNIGKGKSGTGMATEISYTVPTGSLDFWKARFQQFNVPFEETIERLGDKVLRFTDPDGLQLSFVETPATDSRLPWETADIKKDVATKGFHSTTLTLKNIDATAKVLTDLFGYTLLAQEGNRYRFGTTTVESANIIDLLATPDGDRGHNAAGTNHHVAFRVANDDIQMALREKIVAAGHHITPKIDRDYFYSLYFREPGGVLFEIATDNPGFTVDEPLNELGQGLRLPKQYEPHRKEIEGVLPVLK
ncbi:glyoxalase family protein [Chitinophaga jiangningensis]|uniref:Glyoxalase family protein n=1 Tax=Chitinophaga jiangningensis TaxID=1419482 RepID=A0A1M7J6M1_9BACT|nr:ring-cleaving dioxygenase [Chitinophaga jiangningensis]SHM48097.1 glyoxalase family protein [Chitinophaga jiangningensis]